MEKEIRDRMHDGILSAARARYGIAADAIRLLDGFESFMYEFDKDGAAYILRLGHSRRRSPDLIRGEVDWINYLAAGGAGVARAVLSANGRLVEEIPDDRDGAFLATAFVKAPGGPLWQMGGWTDDLLVRYGRLLGRIHALSKSYAPGNPAWRRGTWRDRNNLGLEAILAPGETRVLARYAALMDHLLALPETAAGYGMIHQDAHGGNFFVDAQGEITLFDFDDCIYGHYVYDLAMVLFYAVTNRDDAAEFGPHFWRHFMTGYTQETDIDAAWLAEVPHFMKLREIDLYAITMRDFADPPADSWVGRFLHNRQARIEAGVPYLEMDFVNWQRAGAAAAAPAPNLVEVGGAARQGLEPLFAPLEAYLTPTFVLRQGELGRAFAGGGTAVCWSGHRVFVAGAADAARRAAVRRVLETAYLPAHGAERIFLLHAAPAWQPQVAALLAGWRVHPLRRRVYRLDARGGSWTPRLPAGYALRPVDAALLADETISNLDWVTEEMVSERPSVDAFLAHSFGYCVQHGRDIVAWCMSEYNSGSRCELGIATAEAHQRRGLARATGTAVIRHALAQGVYDIGWVCAADNAASVATAEALGFRLVIDDTVWWVRG